MARPGFLALALALVAGWPGRGTARDIEHAIDFGAGAFIPLDAEHRAAYGTGSVFSLGYSPRVSTGDTYLILDLGLTHSKGQEYQSDPTFRLEDATYWLVPVSIGIRTNVIPPERRTAVRFYIGAALQSVWTGWYGPLGESHRSPVFGLGLEIRPQVQLGEQWGLWVRQRFSLLSQATYGPTVGRFGYSGSVLEMGLNRGLR